MVLYQANAWFGDTASGCSATLRSGSATHPAYVEGGRTLSYVDLLGQVERVAAAYAEAGLTQGDRVVLWGPNSIDWAIAALAVTYAGGVLVPANSRYVGPEVADLVARTSAGLVVVHDGFLGRDQVRELADVGRRRPGRDPP